MKTVTTSLLTHMTPNPVTIEPDASLDEAIELLELHGFRHLPVVSGDRLLGILSDHDLRLATSLLPAGGRLRDAEGREVPGPERVGEIMTAPVHTLSCGDAPSRAANDMVRMRIGAIPVLDDAEVLGIVTETNLLQAFSELVQLNRGACDDLARYNMRTPLTSVSPDASIEEALDVMDASVAHLGVVRDGLLVGIVSQRDLFVGIAKEMIEDAKAESLGRMEDTALRVASVMTPDVITIEPGESMARAARTMIACRFSALPVVEAGQPVGILTQRAILEYYAGLVNV